MRQAHTAIYMNTDICGGGDPAAFFWEVDMNSAPVCTSESRIGKTLFIVTEKCSPDARETIDEKLLKIMSRHVAGGDLLSESYQNKHGNGLLYSP